MFAWAAAVAAASVSGTSVWAVPGVVAGRTTAEPDAPCAGPQAEHAIATSTSARKPTTDLMAEG
jgi:hypothetical protein